MTLVAMLALGGAPGGGAAGGDGSVYVHHPEIPGGLDDPNNIVDREDPTNNECPGAEGWPILTRGTSTGRVGPQDREDWSMVEVYRTETLAAQVTGADVLPAEQSSPGCMAPPQAVPSAYAQENGLYPLRVSAAAGATTTSYTLTFDITPNDPSGPGTDVGNTAETAFFLNAFPRSADPQKHVLLSGSLPNRADQVLGPDQDWYRIGTSLAPSADTQGPAVGLLTVYFKPDCNGGTYQMALYQADGMTPIWPPAFGCGSAVMRSCVATGLAPILVRTAVDDRRGTGYDFAADLSPLYIVNLEDGVQRSFLDPQQPWCDLASPLVFATIGKHVGLVDEEGRVVASIDTR